MDKDTVDAAMHCIMKTGLFDIQYKSWTGRDKAQNTWPNFKKFWSLKINVKRITTQAANTYGFGGNVQQQTVGEIDHKYAASMGKFTNAHNSSQATIEAQ